MKISTIIRRLFTVSWFIFCLIGISGNCTNYDFYDWIIALLITFIPFIIYSISKKRNPSIPNSKQNHKPTNATTKKVTNAKSSTRTHPKCNCDGCPKQENCEYGHVVYDEFDGRLSLFDKYMRLNCLEKFEDVYDLQDKIATNEELHNKKLLLKLDKQCLINTKTFLEAQKQWFLSQGKCGRSYFYFMNMHKEMQLVDEAIKDYDFYNRVSKN